MTSPQFMAKTHPPLPDGRGSDSPFRNPQSAIRIRSRFAFTLIEMLVVIAIIAILMATIVAVGTSVRANANHRSTVAELKLLSQDMHDYLDAGNTEPLVPSPWPYATGTAAYVQTTPASDPYDWVMALQSDPRFAKKIAGLQTKTDSDATAAGGSGPPTITHTLILDSFGTPIRYVPSSGTTPGYFFSAGADGKFSNANPAPSKSIVADEIYSTDPQ